MFGSRGIAILTGSLLLLLWCGGAGAAAFRDVPYGEYPEQRLDVYTPERPGPHPVAMFVHGGLSQSGSKRDAGNMAVAFTARGYVFVAVDYRSMTPTPGTVAAYDVAAAVAWFSRHASSYSGDRSRLFLIGHEVGGQLAALTVADNRRLGGYGLDASAIAGLVTLDTTDFDLVDAQSRAIGTTHTGELQRAFGSEPELLRAASPLLQLRDGDPLPPILLIYREHDRSGRRQNRAFAERVRKLGVATVVLPVARSKRALAADLGSSGDGVTSQVLAWLAAQTVPRVQRFENLHFSTEPLPQIDAHIETVTGHQGRLYAGVSAVVGVRIVVKAEESGTAWATEAEFSERHPQSVWLGELPAIDEVRPHLAVLLRDDAGLTLSVRAHQRAAWSTPQRIAGLTAPAGAVHVATIAQEPASILIGDDSGAVRLRIDASADVPILDVQAESEVQGPVLGFAVADGRTYASIGGLRPALLRRGLAEHAGWQRIAELSTGGVSALSSVPDPVGAARNVLIGMQADGLVLRIDPGAGFATAIEIDVVDAFRRLWGARAIEVQAATASFIALRQPESADRVDVLGLQILRSDAGDTTESGAYYLVRQLDGSYSSGLADDLAPKAGGGGRRTALSLLQPSPFVADGARALYVAGVSTSGKSWLLRGALNRASPPRGLWWDRAHPGHGIDLQRVDDRWALMLYTYTANSSPVWYFAVGDLVDAVFTADANGLGRYTWRVDRSPQQQRDSDGSGLVSMRFGASGADGPCNDGADRRAALALAVVRVSLGERDVQWCMEPYRAGDAGTPEVGSSGLWFAGEADQGWGLSIAAQGYDGRTRETAVLFYYDAAGNPRWALGAGASVKGSAAIELQSFQGPCPGCAAQPLSSTIAGSIAHRFSGFCGEASGTARIELRYPGAERGVFRRRNTRLESLSKAGCY